MAVALTSLLASASSLDPRYSGPRSIREFRTRHPYHRPVVNHRRKIHIRSSRNETDDISADFYAGLKKANHGGTLVLPKSQTFVIGKKLDLTFLRDVHVNLEGTILVSEISVCG